mgnify:CR=1 FL=1
MSDTLALEALHDAVVARFTADATPCTLLFGWKERAQQAIAPRIVMVPGDETGALGEWLPARQPGRNPRSLGTLGELFHVVISAQDPTAPENDRAQYKVTRLLFDAWWRAAFLFAGARLQLVAARWLVDRITRRFGGGMVVTCSYEAMIPDAPLYELPFAPRGVIDGEMLGITQQATSGPAIPASIVATVEPITLSGAQTIDGVAIVADNRVLVTGQVDPVANGIYVAASGAWARADDDLISLMIVRASAGTTGPAIYQLTSTGTITPGVTAQTWTRITPE